ncbi:MAG TPA: hypothetical protein VJY39_23240 [Acidisphaera sp.]|nr:hypothetical protein [Acidisphaera sp.]
MLVNRGVLEAARGGVLSLSFITGGTMSLWNDAAIDAGYDGTVRITSAVVNGPAGFNILDGGDLQLDRVTFAGPGSIRFGPAGTATGGTLELDHEPALTPLVRSFEVGDLVKIDNFTATKILAFDIDQVTAVDVIGAGKSHPTQTFTLAGAFSASQLGYANVGGAAYVFRTS